MWTMKPSDVSNILFCEQMYVTSLAGECVNVKCIFQRCLLLLFTHSVTAPAIEECREEIHACEGEHVTLKIKVSGIPKPTIIWSIGGRKVEGDYASEFEQDGSLTFVSVELKHTGTYYFTATNGRGSVEGTTKLVVYSESEREKVRSGPTIDSDVVGVAKFGDHVSSMHAQNNAGFTSQYWVFVT